MSRSPRSAKGRWATPLARGEPALARRLADEWLARFGDRYYLGLERLGREGEEALLDDTVRLAAERGMPVVATNDVRFLNPGEFEAHEARVCIQEGWILGDPDRPRRYTEEQYLRSAEEMRDRFADVPEAIENTVEIARRCSVEIELGKDLPPEYPVELGESAEGRFAQSARAGLVRRLGERADAPGYRERLEYEIEMVSALGFSGYYLIVADFVAWARENGVPVGPGRGSGAGSLAAWALGITDIDPIAYDLLFERFLNPERISMPDFDIDFCMEGRDRVIEYVIGRYGSDRVSQIITFGTMAAKAVVRDAGRGARPSVPLRGHDREAHPLRSRDHPRPRARRGDGAAGSLRPERGRPLPHRPCPLPRRSRAERRADTPGEW